MNDSDMYDVMHASTSDEVTAIGYRTPAAEQNRTDMMREVLTLIYRTAMELDAEQHPADLCGRWGGYSRHRRAGEKLCDRCSAFRRRYEQALAQRKVS